MNPKEEYIMSKILSELGFIEKLKGIYFQVDDKCRKANFRTEDIVEFKNINGSKSPIIEEMEEFNKFMDCMS